MIRESMYIDRYDWRVCAYLAADAKDAGEIIAKLEEIGINASQMMRAERHVQRAALDSGMTYSSLRNRTSVFVVSIASSEEETFNTFSHELRHLADDIAKACDIPPEGEQVAYLTGDIALALASSLLHIVCHCPTCRER